MVKNSILGILCAALIPGASAAAADTDVSGHADIRYIFVHGLSGWGSYDQTYKRMPYWGMLGGNLVGYLNQQGYSCYAASVAPEGSAWDRACELYAQLSGTMTDYGKEHSERCHHERYGRDFSTDPLIPDWEDGAKIVLFGHSFGGATIRLFSEILANGSAEEQNATDTEELSAFFSGGQGERLFALITLAAPTNGTTAYDMHTDPAFDAEEVQVSVWDSWMGKLFSSRKKAQTDERIPEDHAAYDMYIDHALALNSRIATLPDVYYFAVPCSATTEDENGNHVPVRSMMEGMFSKTSATMGRYTGTTAGGFEIDDSWKENDGLVNTVSAMAPLGEPSVSFDPETDSAESVKPGVWNVLPVYEGDHMSLQGGLTKINNIRPFYLEMIQMIEQLTSVS